VYVEYAVVVATHGSRSLQVLLDSLGTARGPRPDRILVADDRPVGTDPLWLDLPGTLRHRIQVIRTGNRGLVHARNAAWRSTASEWVVFLADDVVLPNDWPDRLFADLVGLRPSVAACQARVRVPLPRNRLPTVGEQHAAAESKQPWSTVDVAYRRQVLALLRGFNGQLTTALRAEADLARRAVLAGYELRRGQREVVRPVRRAAGPGGGAVRTDGVSGDSGDDHGVVGHDLADLGSVGRNGVNGGGAGQPVTRLPAVPAGTLARTEEETD
jgi:GT2 family glycosyltransferase